GDFPLICPVEILEKAPSVLRRGFRQHEVRLGYGSQLLCQGSFAKEALSFVWTDVAARRIAASPGSILAQQVSTAVHDPQYAPTACIVHFFRMTPHLWKRE